MRFAIMIPTAADSWRAVRRAEELGFSRAWFYDTQMLSADPFVAMAAAAVKTTRIRLGTVKLADMEEYIRVVRALLREEAVEAEIEGKRRLIRLLNPELGLINTRDPIGLYIAASGPRARQLTVRL